MDPAAEQADIQKFHKLWAARGKPEPGELAEQVALVAQWAREAPDAENDIRGINAQGKRWSDNRSREVATLLRVERFSDRLERARRWQDGEATKAEDPDPRRRPKMTPEQLARAEALMEEYRAREAAREAAERASREQP